MFPGSYTALGLNTDENLISQFPKKIFYGTHKLRLRYTKNKETSGY